ncbi:unnamed protein product [Peniophora sp. CBMAI 1063]|nr:unnamed protein product [Peniophora sp. CBMAI 1063]
MASSSAHSPAQFSPDETSTEAADRLTIPQASSGSSPAGPGREPQDQPANRCDCNGLGETLCSQITYRHVLREGKFDLAQRDLEREWKFAVAVLLPLLAIEITIFGFGSPTFFSMDGMSKKFIAVAGLVTVLGLLHVVQLVYWYAGVDVRVFEKRALDCWSTHNSFAINSRLPLLSVIISILMTSAYVLAVIRGELGDGVWITCGVSVSLVNLQWFLKGCELSVRAFLDAAQQHYYGRRGSNRYSVAFLGVRVMALVITTMSRMKLRTLDDDGIEHTDYISFFGRWVNAVSTAILCAFFAYKHYRLGRDSEALAGYLETRPDAARSHSTLYAVTDLVMMSLALFADGLSMLYDGRLPEPYLVAHAVQVVSIVVVEVWGRVYERRRALVSVGSPGFGTIPRDA